MKGFVQKVRHNEATVWKLLFCAAFAGAVAGTLIVMGGLAALTNFCISNPPLGIGAGMKMEKPLTALTAQVMTIQRAPVTAADGGFQCNKFFRYDWTLWALQVFFLALFGAIWYMRWIHRFLPGLAALGASVTAWHMYKADYIVTMEQWTQGELHTDGFVTCLGLIACCMGNFSLLLLAGPFSEQEPRSPHAPTMPDARSLDTIKNSNGSASFNGGDTQTAIVAERV